MSFPRVLVDTNIKLVKSDVFGKKEYGNGTCRPALAVLILGARIRDESKVGKTAKARRMVEEQEGRCA
jgi:hypothetical protein